MIGFSFQSQNVILRPFEPEDLPALGAYLNHPALAGRRYLPWGGPELAPLSRRQVEAVLHKWSKVEKGLVFAVTRREDGALLGHAECDWGWDPHCPSFSVVIDPEEQRRGYGSQTLGLLLRYLFEHTPAHAVSAWIASWNEPARNFVAHHGFRDEGRMRRIGIRHGAYFDLVVAGLLRPEWQQAGGGAHAPRG